MHERQVYMKRSLQGPLRYGVAALAVGAALLIKMLLDPLTVQDTQFPLVFGAIMVGVLTSARDRAEQSAPEALRFCAGARSASC